jgi:hypothetical protein
LFRVEEGRELLGGDVKTDGQ